MLYFSGFSLQNESELFNFWLKNCKSFCIAGFSYGAIKALEYALSANERIDKVILISPAYFNGIDNNFKMKQLEYFKRNKDIYLKQFLHNVKGKCLVDIYKYYKAGNYDELKELLFYRWEKEKLINLKKKGIVLEIVLGEKDKIINLEGAKNFFSEIAITYFLKNANHLLCEGKNG